MDWNYLNPLTPLWTLAVGLRNWSYDKGILKSTCLRVPVLSVGNLTMGGTGKTPFILWLLDEVMALGYQPGVIVRSYKAQLAVPEWVHTEPGSFLQFGDEAVLLKLKHPGVPILSGPNKLQMALKFQNELSAVNVLLVDDGFQHRALARTLDFVLLDVSVPLKDYSWPPLGRARETLASLKRAQVIVCTRWEQRNEETVAFLNPYIQGKALALQAEQVAEPIQCIAGTKVSGAVPLGLGRGLAFCGLGNPASFLRTLEQKGLQIEEFIKFPDHASYDAHQIKRLVSLGSQYDFIVTSEKDSVKLQEWPFQGPPLYVTPIRLKLRGDLEEFRAELSRNLWKNS